MGAQAAAAAAAQQMSRAQQQANKGKSQPRAMADAPQPKSRMPQPMQAPPKQLAANPYAQQQAAAQMQTSPQLGAASSDQYAASILGLAPPAASAAAASSSSAASGYSAANELFGSKHSMQSSQPAMLGSAFPSASAQRNGASASSSVTSAAVAAAASAVSFARPATATFDALQCPECPPGAEVIVGQSAQAALLLRSAFFSLLFLTLCCASVDCCLSALFPLPSLLVAGAPPDAHQGVEVCTNCGLVIGQVISDESEWRTFSDRRGADPVR